MGWGKLLLAVPPHCTKYGLAVLIPMSTQLMVAWIELFWDLTRLCTFGLPTLNWTCVTSCQRGTISRYCVLHLHSGGQTTFYLSILSLSSERGTHKKEKKMKDGRSPGIPTLREHFSHCTKEAGSAGYRCWMREPCNFVTSTMCTCLGYSLLTGIMPCPVTLSLLRRHICSVLSSNKSSSVSCCKSNYLSFHSVRGSFKWC